jgi:hypothetical protein
VEKLPAHPGVAQPIDLVAVPAARRAHNLSHAARVAADVGAHLLVLCSHRANLDAGCRVAAKYLPSDRVTMVRIPAGSYLPGLHLAADTSELTRGRRSDTHLKRNVAVAVTRQLGWSRLLFLDDDVRGFGPPQAELAMDVLADRPSGPRAVGWAFDDFPDNSMVCHAFRKVGGPQSTFIGGGALAVRVDAAIPHFPRCYNEDWLFLLPYLLDRRSELVLAGTLEQMPFDPFSVPQAAALQEAGDVLAEGLFRLLHEGRGIVDATSEDYWNVVLRDRCAFVVAIKEKAVAAGGDRSDDGVKALDRALTMDHKARDWPTHLAVWVIDWLEDRARWASWLRARGEVSTVAEGLDSLGFSEHTTDTPDLGGRRSAATVPAVAAVAAVDSLPDVMRAVEQDLVVTGA